MNKARYRNVARIKYTYNGSVMTWHIHIIWVPLIALPVVISNLPRNARETVPPGSTLRSHQSQPPSVTLAN